MDDHQDGWTTFEPTADPADRDAILERAAEILADEPTPEEVAEHQERSKRNRMDAIMRGESETAPHPAFRRMGDGGGQAEPEPTPAPPEAVIYKINGDAVRKPGGEFASRKWVLAQLDTLARATGVSLGKFAKDKIAPLLAEIEQSKRSGEAHGRVIDRLSNELAELKREAALAKRLAEQNVKRRVDLLELENSILRAGRSPDDARDDAAELLPKFSEWNGRGQ
jgi:hypothetical protein